MKWLILVHCQRAAVGAPKFNIICKQCAGVCASHIQIGSEIGSLSSVVSGAESDRIGSQELQEARGGGERRRGKTSLPQTRRERLSESTFERRHAMRDATRRDAT